MDDSPQQLQGPPELHSAIADARSVAREQVIAAWQLHLDRIRDQIDSGWREAVDDIFEARFGEVESQLASGYENAVSERAARQLEDAAGYARTTARRELTEQLNQTVRRLKTAESRDAWIQTLLESATDFCGIAALFLLTPRGLKYQGARGIYVDPDAPLTEVPLPSAPAFANAIESKDTIVAMGSPSELSQTVASILGDSSDRRVYLFPIVSRQTSVAVLYTEAGDYDVNVSALELLVALAASSIETGEGAANRTSGSANLVNIGGQETPKLPPKPAWSDLPKAEQEIHLRAQRFARTQIAQILLHSVNQVRQGRSSNNLYGALKGEIDAGRDAFREQFLEACPSMVDYYHLEFVRTLAKDNAEALGPDYPGPMVS